MKKELLYLFTLIFATIILNSCRKDKPIFPEDVVVVDLSYQPVTKGSYWEYEAVQTTNNLNPENYSSKFSMTGDSVLLDGAPYYSINLIEKTGGMEESSVGYFHKKNNIYRLREENTLLGETFEFEYLRSELNEGDIWEKLETNEENITSKSVGKIIKKGINFTVNGTEFKDVIHTEFKIQYKFQTDDFEDFAIYNYYIARGVGIIQVNAFLPSFFGSGDIRSETKLKTHKIEK